MIPAGRCLPLSTILCSRRLLIKSRLKYWHEQSYFGKTSINKLRRQQGERTLRSDEPWISGQASAFTTVIGPCPESFRRVNKRCLQNFQRFSFSRGRARESGVSLRVGSRIFLADGERVNPPFREQRSPAIFAWNEKDPLFAVFRETVDRIEYKRIYENSRIHRAHKFSLPATRSNCVSEFEFSRWTATPRVL